MGRGGWQERRRRPRGHITRVCAFLRVCVPHTPSHTQGEGVVARCWVRIKVRISETPPPP